MKQIAYSNKGSSQQSRILDWFKNKKPRLTTIEARGIGIMSPATRVLELKESGHRIETYRIKECDDNGVEHSGMAQYCYFGMEEKS